MVMVSGTQYLNLSTKKVNDKLWPVSGGYRRYIIGPHYLTTVKLLPYHLDREQTQYCLMIGDRTTLFPSSSRYLISE